MRKTLVIGLIAILTIGAILGCDGGLLGSAPTARVSTAPASGFTVGAAITFDGTGSINPGVGALTYSWSLSAKPAGSTAVLGLVSNGKVSLVPDVEGSYEVTLLVTAGGASHSVTKAIVVTGSQNTIASLSSLSLTGATISFSASTLTYNVNVPNATASTTISAAASAAAATLAIDGKAGSPQTVPLGVGSTTIPIVVTAPDRVTTKTYTIYVTRAGTISNDATLSALSMTDVPIAFAAGTISYSANVANSVASTNVSATTSTAGATFTINGGAATQVPLAVGANVITIVVKAPDNATTKTYTINVNRAASSDAALSALAMTGATLGFAAETIVYNVGVPNATTSTTITATPRAAGATVTINGGTATQVALAAGANVITILVRAPDNATTKTYTINVNRAVLNDAALSALSMTDVPISFAPGTTTYSVNVANSIASTTVAATPNAAGATYTINSGSAAQVALAVGANTIRVVVTALDGATTRTYTVNVNRADPPPSDVATLFSLSMTDASIAFASGTTAYGANVANSVTSTTVSAIASAAGATVRINGGTATQVALAVGMNTITIVVTAPDGATTKTYTVNVTRAASSDATLSALSMTGATLGFAAETIVYNVGVPNSTASTTVSATATQGTASISIGGTIGASRTVNLVVGANAIPVVVTAPDNATTKTYTINVTRAASSDATLSALSMTGASFVFAATTFTYSLQVPIGVTETTVSATATDTGSIVSIAGQEATSATVSLSEGSNLIPIVVTASDGVSTGNYELRITRASQRTDRFVYSYYDSGTLSFVEKYRMTYAYPSTGTGRFTMREKVFTSPYTGRSREVYSRDALGRVAVCETYDVAATPAALTGTMSNVYDGSGYRTIQSNYYDPNGRMIHQERFAYDASGRITDYRYYQIDSSTGAYLLRERETYQYGAEGEILAASYYDGWDDKTYDLEFVDDGQGDRTEVRYFLAGSLAGKDVMTYNANHRALTAIYYWTNGTVIAPTGRRDYFYEDYYPGSTAEIPETGSLGAVRVR